MKELLCKCPNTARSTCAAVGEKQDKKEENIFSFSRWHLGNVFHFQLLLLKLLFKVAPSIT